jgi:hypothetical protein
MALYQWSTRRTSTMNNSYDLAGHIVELAHVIMRHIGVSAWHSMDSLQDLMEVVRE